MLRSLNHIFVLIIIVIFSSCSTDDAFNQFADISPEGWNQYDTLVFSPKIEKAGNYRMYLETRNNKLYPYRNVWFFVSFRYKNRPFHTDTVQLTLADKSGKWLGSGWGSLYNYSTLYKSDLRINQDRAPFDIRIVQGMRDYTLTGLESVGVRIVPAGNK